VHLGHIELNRLDYTLWRVFASSIVTSGNVFVKSAQVIVLLKKFGVIRLDPQIGSEEVGQLLKRLAVHTKQTHRRTIAMLVCDAMPVTTMADRL
jgi:hypothetical protein